MSGTSIPQPGDTYDPKWAAEFKRQVDALATRMHERDKDIELGSGRIVAVSPNGSRYQITVDNTGALTSTLIADSTTAPPPPPAPASPTNTLGSVTQTAVINATLTFNAGNGNLITVADADSAALTTRLSVNAGTLAVTTGGGATITGNNTANVAVSGTATQINAALNGMVFTAPAAAQSVVLQVVTQDDGDPPLSDSDQVTITVTASAPPPAVAPFYAFGSRKDLVNSKYPNGIVVSHKTASEMDTSIRTKYSQWKSALVVNDPATPGGKAVKFGSPYLTVSEGMGYGMLLAVLLEDQALFDALLKTVRNHPAYSISQAAGPAVGNYLMDWKLWEDGSATDVSKTINGVVYEAGGGWNAMDGDQDIAQALLMADRQWGTTGTTYNYLNEARQTIAAIKSWNMKTDGTTKGLGQAHVSRTSDYMVGHFWDWEKAVADAADQTFWGTTTPARCASLIELMQDSFSSVGALMPDFIVNTGGELNGQVNPDTNVAFNGPTPSPGGYGDGVDTEDRYYANAQRNPWRWGSGLVYRNDPRWMAIQQKLTNWIKQKTAGAPANVEVGYSLDGGGMGYGWPPRGLVAGFMNGAQVDSAHQAWVNSCWDWCEANWVVAYYDSELMLLSMIVASGNWWMRVKPGTAPPPPPPAPPPPPPPPPPPAPGAAPTVATLRHPDDFLLTGVTDMTVNSTKAIFVDDNRWGRGGVNEGAASNEFMQEIGRINNISGGPFAARMRSRWPEVPNTEVKGYPSIIVGGRPGYKSPDHRPGWDKWIRLPDGATDTADKNGAVLTQTGGGTASDLNLANGGFTPGSPLPLQLPLTGGLTVSFDWKHNIPPTGQGQFTFDIWLTRVSDQGFGFNKSPITHELMIPVCNWGNYGSHAVAGGRNPSWYDREANGVAGRDWWLYCTKDSPINDVTGQNDGGSYPGLRYNFSGLDGNYTNPETNQPAIGWKMIAFVPKQLPGPETLSGTYSIDLVPLVNYLRGLYDSRGVPWLSGNEWLTAIELGVEPIHGEMDMTIYNFTWNRT